MPDNALVRMQRQRMANPAPQQASTFPGFGNFLTLFQRSQPQVDPEVAALDARLSRITGNMAMNNERMRAKLDDFERRRIVAQRMNMLPRMVNQK